MNTENTVHPVEALLLVAMAVVWAVLTIARAVLVPAVAVVLALLPVAPAAPAPEPEPPAAGVPAPAPHPLVELAEAVAADLAGSTVAELRRMARSAGLPRTLARTGRRADLVLALAELEVAACG